MGRLYAKLNRHAAALEFYNKAGNKNSFTSKLYVQMGNSFLALKNYAEASKAYLLAIKKDSREVEAYKGMARALEEQTRYSEAVIYLKEGSKLTGHHALFAKLGELYFKLKDYDTAIGNFKNALEKSPSNFRYRRLIADVYFAKRDFKTAAGEYEKVIALNSREWVAYHRLGDSYIELRKFESARTIYKMLLSKNPRYNKAAVIRKKLSSLQGVN
jgi:tetratricopeptide (TPR) repeat protein